MVGERIPERKHPTPAPPLVGRARRALPAGTSLAAAVIAFAITSGGHFVAAHTVLHPFLVLVLACAAALDLTTLGRRTAVRIVSAGAAGIALALASSFLERVTARDWSNVSMPYLVATTALVLTAAAFTGLSFGRNARLACITGVSSTIAAAANATLTVAYGTGSDLLETPRSVPASALVFGALTGTNLLLFLAAIRRDRREQRSPLRWSVWAALALGIFFSTVAYAALERWQQRILVTQTLTEATAAADHLATLLDNRLRRLSPERVARSGVDEAIVPGLLWYGRWTSGSWRDVYVAVEHDTRAEELRTAAVSALSVDRSLPSPILLRRMGSDGQPLLLVRWVEGATDTVTVLDPAVLFAPALETAAIRKVNLVVYLNGEPLVASGAWDDGVPAEMASIPSDTTGFGLLRLRVQLSAERAALVLTPFPETIAALGMLLALLAAFAFALGWHQVRINERLRGMQHALQEEIEERKIVEHLLAEREARLQAMLRQLPAIVWTVDRDLVFTSSEGSGLTQLGLRPGEVVGRTLYEYFGTDDPDHPAIRAHRLALEGEQQTYEFSWAGHHYRVRLEPLHNRAGEIEGVIGIAFDVTEQVTAQRELERMATTDPLTGLDNRAAAIARLEALARAGRPFAVLLVDLDGFKAVNDSLGHLTGDTLLREVAARLRHSVRSDDTVARLGGDEFVVLAVVQDRNAARELAARILLALTQPFRIDGRSIAIGASIGITFCAGDGGCDATALLREADFALYEAKRRGKGRIAIYSEELAEEAGAELECLQSLREDIEHGRIAFLGLPVVQLRSGALAGFELLPMWTDTEGKLYSGAQLAALAERGGTDIRLARACLTEALAWLERLPAEFFVIVGFPSRALLDPEAWVDVPERDWRRDPSTFASRLWLDVPTAALEAVAVRKVGHSLPDQSIGVLVRDPVLAPASVEPLLALPKAGLRVPGAFVRSFLSRPESAALAGAILHVANDLGLESFAEGIDDSAVRSALVDLGCAFGEGALFGPPQTLDAAIELATTAHRGAAFASSGEARDPDEWHNR